MNRIPVSPRLLLKAALFTLIFFQAAIASVASEGIIKVLAIGNSFSADAIENNLFDLAKERNIRMVVGNLYIGGAPLTLHVTNAEQNKSVYSYRKTAADGTRTTVPDISIEKALAEEDWDYISFQQASPLSGQLQTIEASLPALFRYVKARATNPGVKFIYHQTWAYSVHSTHAGFANYDRNQEKMYEAIANVSEKVSGIAPIDIVIPAGTAIQNARTSYLGDNFDRDGYHLRMPLGRYVAACTWFEKLFGLPVIGMAYKPAGVSETEKKVAQAAAHAAVMKPYAVTPLTKFSKGPKGLKEPKAPVLIDFGGTMHEGVWNPIVSPLGGKVYVLHDSLNQPTRIKLDMVSRFNGKIGLKGDVTATGYGIPAEVIESAYFGNAKKAVNGIIRKDSEFRLTGLNKRKAYDILLFTPVMKDSLGVQETKIVSVGQSRREGKLNTAGDTSGVVSFDGIRPAADGSITFTFTAGEGNTSEYGYYYLSGARVFSGGK